MKAHLFEARIDFKDYSQLRASWCTLGEGMMPYREIIEYINEHNIK